MIIPFNIKPSSNVLIAGCGGGFDVLAAGFPIGRALEKQGHKVVYSSYSFTNLASVHDYEKINSECILINHNSTCDFQYFPEKFMCSWYENIDISHSVYCYSAASVRSLIDIF